MRGVYNRFSRARLDVRDYAAATLSPIVGIGPTSTGGPAQPGLSDHTHFAQSRVASTLWPEPTATSVRAARSPFLSTNTTITPAACAPEHTYNFPDRPPRHRPATPLKTHSPYTY